MDTVGDETLYFWRRGRDASHYTSPWKIATGRSTAKQILHPIYQGDRVWFGTVHLRILTGGYLNFKNPKDIKPVTITGVIHRGIGEFTEFRHLKDDRYLVIYNIDGCSWAYEGVLTEKDLQFRITRSICGEGQISNGVLESISLIMTVTDLCSSQQQLHPPKYIP
jgi:hypothetical protein